MGQTIDEAKNNALRSAIEQSYGAFISSKTEILNDNIKDEIVSITNGNIHNYKIISQVKIPDGGYAVTLEATVSLVELSTFVKSRGINVEFQGQIFWANIKQMELNKLAEEEAVKNLCEISHEILAKSLDFYLEVSKPVINTEDELKGNYDLTFTVLSLPNTNYHIFKQFFYESIKSIAMKEYEFDNYKNIGINVYPIGIEKLKKKHNKYFNNSKTSLLGLFLQKAKRFPESTAIHLGERKFEKYYLRSDKSFGVLEDFFVNTNKYLFLFDIVTYEDNNKTSRINTHFICPDDNEKSIFFYAPFIYRPDQNPYLYIKDKDRFYYNYRINFFQANFNNNYETIVGFPNCGNYSTWRAFLEKNYINMDCISANDYGHLFHNRTKTVNAKLDSQKKIDWLNGTGNTQFFGTKKRNLNYSTRENPLTLFMDNTVYTHYLKKSFSLPELKKIKEFKIIKR